MKKRPPNPRLERLRSTGRLLARTFTQLRGVSLGPRFHRPFNSAQRLGEISGLAAFLLLVTATLTACGDGGGKAKGGASEADQGEAKSGRFGLTEEQAQSPLLRIGERVLTLEGAAVLLGPPPRRRGGPSEPERRRQFVDDQLQLELLEVEARREGIYDRRAFQELAESTMVSQFVMDLSTPAPEVTEAEARVYYKKHPERFTLPGRARAYHVLVKDERKAETLLKALGSEPTFEDFVSVAKRESEDAYTRDRGGKLPVVYDGRPADATGAADAMTSASARALPDALVRAIFEGSAELGLVPKPIAADDGYHLVYVATRSKASEIPFDAVKRPLLKELRQTRAQREVDEIVSGLMNTQGVERHPELLDAL